MSEARSERDQALLDELMTDVAPLAPDEEFAIEDMTEEEWQTLVEALGE